MGKQTFVSEAEGKQVNKTFTILIIAVFGCTCFFSWVLAHTMSNLLALGLVFLSGSVGLSFILMPRFIENPKARKVFALISLMLAALLIVPMLYTIPDLEKVRVYPERKLTSLSVLAFWHPVFGEVVSYDIDVSYPIDVSVYAKTKDGIAISCRAQVDSVILNQEDIPALERYLVAVAEMDDPQGVISSMLESIVRDSVTDAFALTTSTDIEKRGIFPVSLQTGGRITERLTVITKDILRWEDDATLKFDC